LYLTFRITRHSDGFEWWQACSTRCQSSLPWVRVDTYYFSVLQLVLVLVTITKVLPAACFGLQTPHPT